MITVIQDYFDKGCGRCDRFDTADCSTRLWARGLAALRRVCKSKELEETVKWGHPCYVRNGRNIVLIGALRGDFRLSFFNASLLKDPDGVLEKNGPNTRNADTIRFTSEARVKELEPVIRAYIREAIGYADAGIRPPKEKVELELPAELSDALEFDPELAAAFFKLTPGRQKSYVINLNSAKKPETRIDRIAKFRDKILAGKGALDR